MKRLLAGNLTTPGVAHGFFGRAGGVSTGLYESLNCGPGSKDDPEAVAENRRRVADALGAAELISLSQIHSPIVHTLDAAPAQRLAPPRDGAARLHDANSWRAVSSAGALPERPPANSARR